jgi:hypothetical protein
MVEEDAVEEAAEEEAIDEDKNETATIQAEGEAVEVEEAVAEEEAVEVEVEEEEPQDHSRGLSQTDATLLRSMDLSRRPENMQQLFEIRAARDTARDVSVGIELTAEHPEWNPHARFFDENEDAMTGEDGF